MSMCLLVEGPLVYKAHYGENVQGKNNIAPLWALSISTVFMCCFTHSSTLNTYIVLYSIRSVYRRKIA